MIVVFILGMCSVLLQHYLSNMIISSNLKNNRVSRDHLCQVYFFLLLIQCILSPLQQSFSPIFVIFLGYYVCHFLTMHLGWIYAMIFRLNSNYCSVLAGKVRMSLQRREHTFIDEGKINKMWFTSSICSNFFLNKSFQIKYVNYMKIC